MAPIFSFLEEMGIRLVEKGLLQGKNGAHPLDDIRIQFWMRRKTEPRRSDSLKNLGGKWAGNPSHGMIPAEDAKLGY